MLQSSINATAQSKHICQAHKADTQSQPCKRACFTTARGHTLTFVATQTDREEARTHNKSIAAIGA